MGEEAPDIRVAMRILFDFSFSLHMVRVHGA